MKKALSLIFTVVMCLSLCACGNKATPEMIDAYKNANACLSQGRYEEAAKLYIEADNYEDAEEKLLEIYYYAVNCYEKGSAEEAYSLFEILNGVNINDSAEYIALLERHFCFVEAMDKAKYYLEEQPNVLLGFEWLDKAAMYATEQQKAEVDTYRNDKSYMVYKNSQFVAFDTHFTKQIAYPETTEGKYSYYSYRLTGHYYSHEHDSFKSYYDRNYTVIEPNQIPRWVYDIAEYGRYAYYDDQGNLILWIFSEIYSKKGETTEMDVYVFYADFVESMAN